MSIDKKITYEDQRLTEKEKKKIKPVNQGGGPNYLGKQETVTVPKKWLSDPDHVVAELAYITPREQKILLDANIYGSLKGKPNKGPGGIMSLQGDLGGYDASPGGPNDPNKGSGPVGSDKDTIQKQKQQVQDILTGKLVTGQTGAVGPITKQYSNLPEYMNVLQDDGTYKPTYVGSAYKSYGTPSFLGNLFSRAAPGYRGIKGLSAFGDPMSNYSLDMEGPIGAGYYTDKKNFTEMRRAIPRFGVLGILANLAEQFSSKESDKTGLLTAVDQNSLIPEGPQNEKFNYLFDVSDMKNLIDDRILNKTNADGYEGFESTIDKFEKEGYIENPNIKFGGTVLEDEFPSTSKKEIKPNETYTIEELASYDDMVPTKDYIPPFVP